MNCDILITMKRQLLSLFSLSVCAIVLPCMVFAQVPATAPTTKSDLTPTQISALNYNASVNESDINVLVTPEFPSAFQPVSLRLDSDTIDLNHYFIQWNVDGVPVKNGIGVRDLQVTSGDYGSTTKISVSVNVGATTLRKDVYLSPQDITMLWEAIDSYVPPFYHGKKFPSQESLIKVSAIPNFQNGSSSLALNDAVFLWDRNGNRILNTGGYGKDSIIIQHNRLRKSETIATEISTVTGGSNAKKSITIPIVDPEVHWYTRNLSDYRRLSSVDRGLRVVSGDTKLVAEPYFFSVNQNPSDLNMDWTMNGQQVYLDPNSSKQEILIRNPGENGQTNFGIVVKNPKTFLQAAANSISILFEKAIQ